MTDELTPEKKRALVAELLKKKARRKSVPRPGLRPRQSDSEPPLSFAQQRLWFLEQLEPGAGTYVIPMACRLIGELDVGILQRAVDALVRRHETLRTTFAVRDGEPGAADRREHADTSGSGRPDRARGGRNPSAPGEPDPETP